MSKHKIQKSIFVRIIATFVLLPDACKCLIEEIQAFFKGKTDEVKNEVGYRKSLVEAIDA